MSNGSRSAATRAADNPSLGRHLLGLLLVTHPLPSALYVVMTAFLAFVAAAAAHRALDPLTLASVLLAVACAQIAVGAFNDYCDRVLDAAANRRDKPIVRGDVTPQEAVGLGIAASVMLVAVIYPLGPLAFVLGLLMEALGLAYDFRFKGMPTSAVLFAIGFPLFPLLAWAVFGHWQPFLPWLLPLGAVLGIAMNVANTLSDLEADYAAGIRGLPHLLGLRRGPHRRLGGTGRRPGDHTAAGVDRPRPRPRWRHDRERHGWCAALRGARDRPLSPAPAAGDAAPHVHHPGARRPRAGRRLDRRRRVLSCRPYSTLRVYSHVGAFRSARVAENVLRIDEVAHNNLILACDADTAKVDGAIEAELRRCGRPIPTNDMWIGALALQHDLSLLPRDAHFAHVPNLRTDSW